MPVTATVRTISIGTDPNAAAQPDGAIPVEIFGEIISGLAEASVEGALHASVAATTEAIATETPPPSVEGEVAKTVEQLLALTRSQPAEATIAEATGDGIRIPVASRNTGSGEDVLVPQEVAAALAMISQLPQYHPITRPSDVEAPVPSVKRLEPEALPVSDLPQNTQSVPAQAQPDVVPKQALADVPQPAPAGPQIGVVARQAPSDVPQPAPAGARIGVAARQALADVPQPTPAGARIGVAARQALADVPQPTPAGARIGVAARQATADVSQPAPAKARIGATRAGRDDQSVALPISGESSVEAPQIASSRTEAVVQLAFASLQGAVKAAPAEAWAVPSKATARRSGETEPTIALPEPKLGTATVLPSINPVAAAFELLRPADAAPTGPQPILQRLDAGELEIEHQLDMAHEGEWLDQLARDITRSAGSDGSPLRFRLNPENLGSLRVEISQDRNGAAVRLTTETEAARIIIADAQPRLIAEARAQGIRISEAHVDLGGQTASGDPRRQNAVFEETPLRTARSLQEHGEGDGNPTPGQSERYA